MNATAQEVTQPVSSTDIDGYSHYQSELNVSHDYLLPAVFRQLGEPSKSVRVFDLGCGNGVVLEQIDAKGWSVVGVDPSSSGIADGNARRSHLELHQASAYDDLAGRFGKFDFVISLEVIEHVYAPREYAKVVFDLLKPGGRAIISTPYHSYLKNLGIALVGKMDRHYTALWDNGHIKFWSIDTLGQLLRETGFVDISFERVGRIPVLAKSMVASCTRPAA